MAETEFERIIAAIRFLPGQGEGWLIEDIARAVGTDNAMVVAALQCIVESESGDEEETT